MADEKGMIVTVAGGQVRVGKQHIRRRSDSWAQDPNDAGEIRTLCNTFALGKVWVTGRFAPTKVARTWIPRGTGKTYKTLLGLRGVCQVCQARS